MICTEPCICPRWFSCQSCQKCQICQDWLLLFALSLLKQNWAESPKVYSIGAVQNTCVGGAFVIVPFPIYPIYPWHIRARVSCRFCWSYRNYLGKGKPLISTRQLHIFPLWLSWASTLKFIQEINPQVLRQPGGCRTRERYRGQVQISNPAAMHIVVCLVWWLMVRSRSAASIADKADMT